MFNSVIGYINDLGCFNIIKQSLDSQSDILFKVMCFCEIYMFFNVKI